MGPSQGSRVDWAHQSWSGSMFSTSIDPPRRMRGLWRRRAGEALYAYRNASTNGPQYFYPLHADTVTKALTARQALKDLQRKGELLPPGKLDTSGDVPASVDQGSSGRRIGWRHATRSGRGPNGSGASAFPELHLAVPRQRAFPTANRSVRKNSPPTPSEAV